MDEEILQQIYDSTESLKDIGSFDEFKDAVSTPEGRRTVYDNVPELKNVGTFEEFDEALNTTRTKIEEQPDRSTADQGQENMPPQGSQESKIDLRDVPLPPGMGGIFSLGRLEGTRIGDFVEDTIRAAGRGAASGAGVGESLKILAKGAESTGEDLTELVGAVENQRKFTVSDEFKAFQDAEGFKASVAAFAKAPITIITEAVVESAFAMGRSGGAVIAASGLTGPGAVVATPVALGATSAALETSGKMVEGMQEYLDERGLEFTESNLRTVMADEDAWSEIRKKAITKGAVIGLVDGATAGLVSKMGGSGAVNKLIKGAKQGKKISPRAAKLGTTGKQVAVETTAGGGGELASQLAIGDDLDFKAAVLEVIGEIPGAGASLTSSAIINRKRLGKLTDDEMARAVQDNNQGDFEIAVDVAQQLGQINDEQVNELKGSFTEFSQINESIPDNVSDRDKRNTIIGKISERKKIERKLQEEKEKSVDQVFQEEKDTRVNELREQADAINEEIKQVAANEKAPVEDAQQREVEESLFIEDEALLDNEVELSITNAATGKREMIKMPVRDAQENIRTEKDKLNVLKSCL